MADPIVQSNATSSVIQSVSGKDVDGSDKFIYELISGFPNFSKTKSKDVKAMPNGNAQTIIFDIPRSGLLYMQYLEFELTVATAGYRYTDAFINWINSVQLMCNNKSIEEVSPQSIREFMNASYELPAYEIGALAKTEATTNGAVYRAFVALPFSYQKNPKSYLDTTFLDNMTINISMNSFSSVFLTSTLTSCNVYLHSHYIVLDNDSYKMYREKQFPAGQPLTFLWENSEMESVITAAASVTNNVNLTSRRPVSKTLIKFVNTDATNDAMAVHKVSQAFTSSSAPKTIQFKGNGRVLLELDVLSNTIFGNKGTRYDLYAGGVLADNFDGNLCINWDMLEDALMNEYKGAVSLKNISSPQLVFTSANPTDANDRIYITHKYLNLVEVDSNNGRLAIVSGN